MNLTASRTRLQGLTRELRSSFEETRISWRDSRGQEFERKYLEELSRRVEQCVTTIEKLDQLLSKVRSDCE